MCAVNAKFIYVTGGGYGRGNILNNCHRYDIDRDLWEEMQKMNQARNEHSSCQLGGHIYVFCGQNNQEQKINSVEKLSIDADPFYQDLIGWELIPDANLVALPKLYGHLSVALNTFEILILGGYSYCEPNVHLYDTRTDKCSSIAVNGAFKMNNKLANNYSIAQCG